MDWKRNTFNSYRPIFFLGGGALSFFKPEACAWFPEIVLRYKLPHNFHPEGGKAQLNGGKTQTHNQFEVISKNIDSRQFRE